MSKKNKAAFFIGAVFLFIIPQVILGQETDKSQLPLPTDNSTSESSIKPALVLPSAMATSDASKFQPLVNPSAVVTSENKLAAPLTNVTSEMKNNNELSEPKNEITSESKKVPELVGPKKEATEEKKPIDCVADYLEYDEAAGYIHGKGHVKINYKKLEVNADEVMFNVTTSDLVANGHIIVKQDDALITGDSVKFNLRKQVGSIENIELSKGPWYFKGSRIEKPDAKNASIIECYATTCKFHDHPHYRLVTSRIHIEIDNIIESWGVTVYIGDIPIFWLPYICRSLKNNTSSPLTITPGYSDEEGLFVHVAYHYDISQYMPGSILLDYGTIKGLGYGLRQDFTIPGNGGGYFYTHYIDEQDTGNARWDVDYENTNIRLSNDLSFLGRIHFLSDQAVNLNYNTETVPVNESAINSYGALTLTRPTFNVVCAIERDDLWDVGDNQFDVSTINSPHITFNLNQQTLAAPSLYWSTNADFNYYFTRNNTGIPPGSSYFITKLQIHPSLTYAFKVNPLNAVSMSLTYNASIQDFPDYIGYVTNFVPSNFDTSCTGNINLHTNWNPSVDTDLGYTFQPHFTNLDPEDPLDLNNGVLVSKLNGRLAFRLPPGFTNSMTTAYDLRALDPLTGVIDDNILNRFDNIVDNLDWLITRELNIHSTLTYSIATYSIYTLDLTGNYVVPKGIALGAGVSYANSSVFDVIFDIGFNLSDDTRMLLGTRYDTINNVLKEIKVRITTNLTDCLYADLTFMDNYGNFSIDGSIQLRAFKDNGNPINSIAPEVYKK